MCPVFTFPGNSNGVSADQLCLGSAYWGLTYCNKNYCSSFPPSSPSLAASSYLCAITPLHQQCYLCSCTGSQPRQLTTEKCSWKGHWGSSSREGTSIMMLTGRRLAQAAATADIRLMLSGYHWQYIQNKSVWEGKTGQNHLLKRQDFAAGLDKANSPFEKLRDQG